MAGVVGGGKASSREKAGMAPGLRKGPKSAIRLEQRKETVFKNSR